MFVPDVSRSKAVIVVFAMHGCPPCEQYLPQLRDRIEAHAAAGVPLHVWSPGEPIAHGEILVLFYDAGSKNDELQDLADRLGITATPTTCLLTQRGITKHEGSMPADKIDQILAAAHAAYR